MLDLTLGKFFFDLRALCALTFVNGRLDRLRPPAPFALFHLSDFFALTPHFYFGNPLLVLDDVDLLALDFAPLRSAFLAHCDSLAGIIVLQNLNAPQRHKGHKAKPL